MANQANGKQQMHYWAVLACENIDDQRFLINVLGSMRNKHSLHILPEQYDIVGHNLIRSI
jgi:nitric oxide dioxygenase